MHLRLPYHKFKTPSCLGSTFNLNPSVTEGLSSKTSGDAAVQRSSVFIISYFQMNDDGWGPKLGIF
jgi:hypothetical protein